MLEKGGWVDCWAVQNKVSTAVCGVYLVRSLARAEVKRRGPGWVIVHGTFRSDNMLVRSHA